MQRCAVTGKFDVGGAGVLWRDTVLADTGSFPGPDRLGPIAHSGQFCAHGILVPVGAEARKPHLEGQCIPE